MAPKDPIFERKGEPWFKIWFWPTKKRMAVEVTILRERFEKDLRKIVDGEKVGLIPVDQI